jgi:shikimate kinase
MIAVALVGFMGAGKTTVGRALAARLGWRFEDLDDRIRAREERSIEQIFQESGEPAFRKLESAALRDLLFSDERTPLVAVLGGGAFVQEINQQRLLQRAIPVVFLDAPVEELFRRCEQPEIQRPLRRSLEQFSELYRQRKAAYLRASVHIDTAGKDIGTIVEEIISTLNLGVNA